MKHRIIYILLFTCLCLGGINAQIECVESLDVTLDQDGKGQIIASDLVPDAEFYIANGTLTYFIVPFNTGILSSESDTITIGCDAAWSGLYIVEYTQDDELIESCSGMINVLDPTNSCPNYSICEDATLDCKKAVDGYSYYPNPSIDMIPAENFAICPFLLDCPGSYQVAIGQISDAATLSYNSDLDTDDIVNYITPIVLSYTENGVTEYDNSLLYAWQNLDCFIIPVSGIIIELDISGEVTIVPNMFLHPNNTCSGITLAVSEVNGDVPTDFFDDITLGCDDIGYRTVYLKDEATGMVVTSQFFLADPLEICGPILGSGDKLIRMSNDPPLGTYANTLVSINGISLPLSSIGKGWIINENMLVDGINTLNFDSYSYPFSLNGVSTLDLVLLQKLIIFDEFDSPIESIVMDVDNSGYNGIGDLVLTRSLILGFPNTLDLTNVLFIPKELQFPSDFNPFDFDYDFTKYEFEKVDFNDLSFRFEAYKIGDSNGNAATEDGLKNEVVSSTRDFDVFEVSDMEVIADIPFTFNLSYDSGVSIKGLLAALVSNGITFQSLTSEHGNEVDYNIIDDSEIRISYLASNPSASIDKISFEITANSSKSGDLIDLLGLKAGFPQEVINEDDEVINIEDIEESTTTSTSESQLSELNLSIYPNPVSQRLMISSLQGSIGKFEVIDPMGKNVLSGVSELNEIQIDVSQLAKGVYYINIENEKIIANKSFVKI